MSTTYEERTKDVTTTVTVGQWIDEMCAQLAAAGNEHLAKLGMKGAVVVNVAWTDDPKNGYMCIGSKVPDDAPEILAESLRESAREVHP